MFYVYNLSNGLFNGMGFNAVPRIDAVIAANTPSGCGAMELDPGQVGRVRVDVESGALVSHEAPQPSADTLRRLEAQTARNRLIDEIRTLEAGQPRALRSLVIDPADARAKLVLLDIETQIAELRTQLGALM